MSYDPKMHDHAMNPTGGVGASIDHAFGDILPQRWPWQDGDEQVLINARPAKTTLDRQVGGGHYKTMPIQPWQVIDSMYPGKASAPFYIGTAIAYFMRWEQKGGVEDIKKGIHTLEHFVEQVELTEQAINQRIQGKDHK